MTKWYHKCDLGWLKTRQKHLTATDVKELLPFTKTGRKKTITDETYLKVWSSKMVNLTEDDCVSTGAAARGHILEPYAIDRFNEANVFGNLQLYHWDDIIVTRPEPDPFSLAFSPDAMELIPPNQGSIAWVIPSTIVEVKSYYPERHTIAGYTPKENLEERWQIATAMAVCESIEEAYLLFYNPSMKNQLYIVNYDRADLEAEIDIVLDIERDWLDWIKNRGNLDHHYIVAGKLNAEEEIIRSIMRREELNPEGEKSVIR